MMRQAIDMLNILKFFLDIPLRYGAKRIHSALSSVPLMLPSSPKHFRHQFVGNENKRHLIPTKKAFFDFRGRRTAVQEGNHLFVENVKCSEKTEIPEIFSS